MTDAPTRAVRDLIRRLEDAPVDLPDDLGSLGADEESAAFIRAAANLPATDLVTVEVEVDAVYVVDVEVAAGAGHAEAERLAVQRYHERRATHWKTLGPWVDGLYRTVELAEDQHGVSPAVAEALGALLEAVCPDSRDPNRIVTATERARRPA